MTAKLSGPMLAPKSGTPRQIVVLLHGYGSDGQDLIALGSVWRDLLPDALFVAPNAPEPCGGAPFGYQWFAIDYEGDRLAERQTGVVRAAPVLLDFLDALWGQTGLSAAETVLAGFSQGAMMALHAGLALEEPPLGIIAFSGALLPPAGYDAPEKAKPPICLVHGDRDEVVPAGLSAQAKAMLDAAGYRVDYHVSPGAPHTIAPDGLDFASRFLETIMSDPSRGSGGSPLHRH